MPLPLITFAALPSHAVLPFAKPVIERMLCITGAALNFMYTGGRTRPVPKNATKLHRGVYSSLLDRLLHVLRNLEVSGCDLESHGFARVVGRGDLAKYPKLDADRVDVAADCGLLDPLPHVDAESAALLESPESLFDTKNCVLPTKSEFTSGPRR